MISVFTWASFWSGVYDYFDKAATTVWGVLSIALMVIGVIILVIIVIFIVRMVKGVVTESKETGSTPKPGPKE